MLLHVTRGDVITILDVIEYLGACLLSSTSFRLCQVNILLNLVTVCPLLLPWKSNVSVHYFKKREMNQCNT